MTTFKKTPVGFVLTDDGVYYRRPGQEDQFISRSIHVKATVSVTDSTAKFVVVEFDDYNGEPVELKMPRADFLNLRSFRRELENGGFEFPEDARLVSRLHKFIATRRPDERWEIVDRVGWHGNEFVLPGLPADTGDKFLRFEPANSEHYTRYDCEGTLDEWKQQVAALALCSSRLVFSISLALAAPLMRFSNVESGGFHLFGGSTGGKTTSLLAATSVAGPVDRNDLFTWDNTITGLEELAVAHNDCLLCLDESAQIEGDAPTIARKSRQAAYKLAGGRGRGRSRLYGQNLGLREFKWKLLFLSSGEKAMFELASEAYVNRLEGEQVRFIDVPAIADDKYGIYEFFPAEFASAEQLSDAIESGCRANHGVALRSFLEKVKVHAAVMDKEVETQMDIFMKGARVPNHRWERRFARRFALAFAAGAIAGKFGIVPWDHESIGKAIRACYLAARAALPDAEQLRTEGLARLRSQLRREEIILDLNRSGHTVNWTPEEAQAAEAFRRSGPPGVHYLIQPEIYASWFDSPLQANLVVEELDRQGYLIEAQRNLRTLQVEISGINKRRRYYAIRETILSST
jgi:putative DNA primase/helicase